MHLTGKYSQKLFSVYLSKKAVNQYFIISNIPKKMGILKKKKKKLKKVAIFFSPLVI